MTIAISPEDSDSLTRFLAHARARSVPTAAMLTAGCFGGIDRQRNMVVLVMPNAFLQSLMQNTAKQALLRDAARAVFGEGYGVRLVPLGPPAKYSDEPPVPPIVNLNSLSKIPDGSAMPPTTLEAVTGPAPAGSEAGPRVRTIEHEGVLHFSVVDVIGYLTGSAEPGKYWSAMKSRDRLEASKDGIDGQLSTICRQRKLEATDGKRYATDCATVEGILRIVQSIPSPKVEHLKMWLARVGYERMQEDQEPELALARIRDNYRVQGRPKGWIEKRMRGINVRNELTGEWDGRGATENKDYAILTNRITRGTFGMTVADYKSFKGLKKESLRDNMTDMELILTMLGEATATQLHRSRNSQGIDELGRDADNAGAIAGRTRAQIEAEAGRSVVSPGNFLGGDRARPQIEGSEAPELEP